MSRIMSVVVLLCLSTCTSGRGNERIPASIVREFANFRCPASPPRRLLPPSTVAAAAKDTTSLIKCPLRFAERSGGRCIASKAVRLSDCAVKRSSLLYCFGESKKKVICLNTKEECCWYCKITNGCKAWTFVSPPGKCYLYLTCPAHTFYNYSRASGSIVSRTIGAVQVATVSAKLSD